MCNRIEDLIEKARHYEDLWHEALDENKFLKLEVERLKNNCVYLDKKLDEEIDDEDDDGGDSYHHKHAFGQ